MSLALASSAVTVMGQSALRSLLLGAVVFAVLRLLRLRDLRAETAIWTAVLVAALAMPMLGTVLPGVSFNLPTLPHHPAVQPGPLLAAPARLAWPPVGLVLAAVYSVGVAIGLARIFAGLALVAALYARAEPVREPWARGKAIRASVAVDGPLSFARCILLPADFEAWPETKRLAVLAHEQCHIDRGDFFIQLLAAMHRALFWFSPFPWWLQRKLGELAETASDDAGARQIGDAASYAEILVDVTRSARRSGPRPGYTTGALAMAHGPTLARRVDHLLTSAPERVLGRAAKALSLAAVATASLGLAAVHTALAQSGLSPYRVAEVNPAGADQAPDAGNAGAPAPRTARHGGDSRVSPLKHRTGASSATARSLGAQAPGPTAAKTADPDQPSYDPLALLHDNDTVAVLPVILTGRGAAARD
jgi:beta-lactamase regulating signal transducer with metallopeptidase domain